MHPSPDRSGRALRKQPACQEPVPQAQQFTGDGSARISSFGDGKPGFWRAGLKWWSMAGLWKAYAAGLALLCAGVMAAQQQPSFDYYILSLSWAPEFCANSSQAAANPGECSSSKPMNFVVHGLWPEAERGRSPESCGKAAKVSRGLVHDLLPYMPSEGLINHEWATHGTCTGLSQKDYFTRVMLARAAVQLPVQITSIGETEKDEVFRIESEFAGANASFPEGAFRVACRNNALTEVRVCFDKDLKGRACPATVSDCKAGTITIRR
jgi:ribonuclease T2